MKYLFFNKQKKNNYKKFFSIEVDVKNCNNLITALKNYFKEEI